MGKRKQNPVKRRVTLDEIQRAADSEKEAATVEAWAVFFSVLFDKHGFDRESIKLLWDDAVDVSRKITDNDEFFQAVKAEIEADVPESRFVMAPFEARSVKPDGREINRGRRWARQLARNICWVIFLKALKRAENPGPELLGTVYQECLYLCDSIDTGRIKGRELHKALEEEEQVVLV